MSNKWFFTELPLPFKLLTIFVKGDLIVLAPLIILILLTGFISLKFMLVLVGAYLVVRYLGEMIYWLLQQFSDKKYRPYDFGFKNLDNNAIYILYQTMSLFGIMIGIGIFISVLMFLK